MCSDWLSWRYPITVNKLIQMTPTILSGWVLVRIWLCFRQVNVRLPRESRRTLWSQLCVTRGLDAEYLWLFVSLNSCKFIGACFHCYSHERRKWWFLNLHQRSFINFTIWYFPNLSHIYLMLLEKFERVWYCHDLLSSKLLTDVLKSSANHMRGALTNHAHN